MKKVIILGTKGTGKKSVFAALQKQLSNASSVGTRDFVVEDNNNITLNYVSGNLSNLKIEIWNFVASAELSDAVILKHLSQHSYFEGAAAALVVYDITNSASFQYAKANIDFFVQEQALKSSVQLITLLIGNKKDLESNRQVAISQIHSLSDEYNDAPTVKMAHVEVSTLTNENIDTCALVLSKEIDRAFASSSSADDWADVSLDIGAGDEDLSVYDSSNAHKAAATIHQASVSQFLDSSMFSVPPPENSFPPAPVSASEAAAAEDVSVVNNNVSNSVKLPPPPPKVMTTRKPPPPPANLRASLVQGENEMSGINLDNSSFIVNPNEAFVIPVIGGNGSSSQPMHSIDSHQPRTSSLDFESSVGSVLDSVASVSSVLSFKEEPLQFEIQGGDYTCCAVQLKPQQSVIAPSNAQVLFMSGDIHVTSLSESKSKIGAILGVIEQALKRKKIFKYFSNRTFSQHKEICFFLPRLVGQMHQVDLQEHSGGLYIREAHIVCASDGTVFMPEQKTIGLKVKDKQTTIVRTAGQGSIVLQANGALIVRKLKDSVHELIMPPAALIAYDSSCNLKFDIFQNKLKVTGPGYIFMQSRPINVDVAQPEVVEQSVNAEEKMEFIGQYDEQQQSQMYNYIQQQIRDDDSSAIEEEKRANLQHSSIVPPPPPQALLLAAAAQQNEQQEQKQQKQQEPQEHVQFEQTLAATQEPRSSIMEAISDTNH